MPFYNNIRVLSNKIIILENFAAKMRLHTFFTIFFIVFGLLLIIPIVLFYRDLKKTTPDSQEQKISAGAQDLIAQRTFPSNLAFTYLWSEKMSYSLPSYSYENCTEKQIYFTIYSLGVSGQLYLSFKNYSYSSNIGSKESFTEDLTDVLSFEFDDNFQFKSFVYSNSTNQSLVDIARTIIFQFLPNLMAGNYQLKNATVIEYDEIYFGNMSLNVSRTLSTSGDNLTLTLSGRQNNTLNNVTYWEETLMNKLNGTIYSVSSTQTLQSSLQFRIFPLSSTTTQDLSMGIQTSKTVSSAIFQGNRSVDSTEISQLKYAFLTSLGKIREYTLFSNSSSFSNSNSSSNRLLSTSTQNSQDLATLNVLGQSLTLSSIVDNWDRLIEASPMLTASQSLELKLYPYKFIDFSGQDTCSTVLKLAQQFYDDKTLLELNSSSPLGTAFTSTSPTLKSYSSQRIILNPLPPNPMMMKGGIYFQFTVDPTIEYHLDRIVFCQKLNSTYDFADTIFQNTKLYSLFNATDNTTIKSLKTETLSNLFLRSQFLNDSAIISLKITVKTGIDLQIGESRYLRVDYQNEELNGQLSVNVSSDFYSNSRIVESNFNVQMSYPKTLYYSGIKKTGLLEESNQIYQNSLYSSSSQPWAASSQTSQQQPMSQYTSSSLSNGSSNLTAIPTTETCPLSFSIESDVKCFSNSPCGCSLFPYQYTSSSNSNYINNSKGITDACETELPLINEEYFSQYRMKKSCKTPYQTIDPSTCQPVSDWFYIGDGFVLDPNLRMTTNYSEIMKLPSEFFSGATMQTASLAAYYQLTSTTLDYYNQLALNQRIANYPSYYNSRLYYSDAIATANDFQTLPRSIRTAFYLFMDSFERQNGIQDSTMMDLLKNFYEKDFIEIADFCDSSSNNAFCNSANLYPISTLLKYSCTKCDYKTSALDLRILFLLDGSGSIANSDFTKSKSFAIAFLTDLQTNKYLNAKAGALQYSSYTHKISDFSSDLTSVINSISYESQISSSTDISYAFQQAKTLFQNDVGFNGSRYVFIITDGCSTSSYKTDLTLLRQSATMTIVAIGVGTGICLSELYDYAGSSDNVILMASFNSLTLAQDIIGTNLCYSVNDDSSGGASIAGNQTLSGASQKYYKISYYQNLGKTITFNIPSSSGSFAIFASESYPFPNENLCQFTGKMTATGYVLMIPSRGSYRRILQNSTTTDPGSSLSYYVSIAFNFSSSTDLSVNTTDGIASQQACFTNCAKCDISGQICSQCNEGFALENNKCQSTSITENIQNNPYVSGDTSTAFMRPINAVTVWKEGTTETNKPYLIGLILCAIAEFFCVVLTLVCGCKSRRKNRDRKDPAKINTMVEFPSPALSPELFQTEKTHTDTKKTPQLPVTQFGLYNLQQIQMFQCGYYNPQQIPNQNLQEVKIMETS